MPQAGQRPDDKEVEQPARHAHAVAAERDIHVIAEEGGQGHVPAPPEIRDRTGDVGVVEVLGIVEAEHPAHADRHVGIGREVQIDLQHVGRRAEPALQHREALDRREVLRKERGVRGRGGREQQLIGQRAAGVGQQRLLRQADREAAQAGQKVPAGLTADEKLARKGLVADDRAGDALVEQRRVEQHVPVAALGVGVAAVDVDDVGHQLEGIERNADRQRDARDEVGDRPEDRADQRGVFEKADERDIHRDRDRQPHPGRLDIGRVVDAQGAVPARQRHEHQQQNILRLSPRVKDQREDQQGDVLAPAVRADEIHEQGERKKGIYEQKAGKNHGQILLSGRNWKGGESRAEGSRVRNALFQASHSGISSSDITRRILSKVCTSSGEKRSSQRCMTVCS